MCPLAMAALATLIVLRIRNRSKGVQQTRSLGFAAVAVAGLFGTVIVYGYGEFDAALYQDVEMLCPVNEVGTHIGWEYSDLPLRRTLLCSEGNVELVPVWVNPALLVLFAVLLGSFGAALVTWRRGR
jgi:hypothetical protein